MAQERYRDRGKVNSTALLSIDQTDVSRNVAPSPNANLRQQAPAPKRTGDDVPLRGDANWDSTSNPNYATLPKGGNPPNFGRYDRREGMETKK